MNKKNIESALKNIIEQATPDVLESILSQCGEQNGKVIKMTKSNNKRIIRSITGIAAAFAIIIVGLFVFKNASADSVYSTVTFDVNPSVEISVTDKEKVLDVRALNEDAKVVLGKLDFKDASLDVAVNAIIGSMVRNGYIDELSNSILISVDSKNTEAGKTLREKLNQEVESILKINEFSGAVLSQTVEHSDDIDDKAEKYGITVGKAQLIKQITSADGRYTFEQLVPLSINELNLISKSGEKLSSKVTVSGEASDKKYIGLAKAKEIALKNSGIAEGEYTNYKWELDYEDGKMIYEIEIYSGNTEHEYDIDAVSGEILKAQKEKDDDINGVVVIPNDEPVYVGREAAKSAALKHAGLKAADCKELEVELDEDNGIAEYQVEFKSGGYEYEYEIDAKTGKIIKSEKEPADN